MGWPEDVEDSSLISAIHSSFSIDPIFDDRLADLEKKGLIRKTWYWEVTKEGEVLLPKRREL